MSKLPFFGGVGAVALLTLPSAYAVYVALSAVVPPVIAVVAAGGIEVAYLSLATLQLERTLRAPMRAVMLVAVFVAVLAGIKTHYAALVPGALASGATFAASFDWLAATQAVVFGAAFPVLAVALALLLHLIGEDNDAAAVAPLAMPAPAAYVFPREDEAPAPALSEDWKQVAAAYLESTPDATNAQVARHVGVHPATVGRWRTKGGA